MEAVRGEVGGDWGGGRGGGGEMEVVGVGGAMGVVGWGGGRGGGAELGLEFGFDEVDGVGDWGAGWKEGGRSKGGGE